MKPRLLVFCLTALLLLFLPAALGLMQGEIVAPVRLEITGVNATSAPVATVTVNVIDNVGQPVRGLGIESFRLSGSLANVARIVRVESITDDALSFGVVLVIDTSTSMSGSPLDLTKQAAKEFVNALNPNDPISLISFDSSVRTLVDFTTDRASVLTAIDGLVSDGQTALYDAGIAGVLQAASAPTARRAVVLLSDGGEYGGASLRGRDAARESALTNGVPVYTIGLGFGQDRSYLQDLSLATNARFYESPTPEELADIYRELSDLFKSQYVLTLDVQAPLDGQIYPFTLQAQNAAGMSDLDAATLRAPIPVPLVSISPQPTAPISSPTTFEVVVRADDAISEVVGGFGDNLQPLQGPPYRVSIDPRGANPGDYVFTARATDATGDTTEASVSFAVSAIPPSIVVDIDLGGLQPLTSPVTVNVTAETQTPDGLVDLVIDGTSVGEPQPLPAVFTIDPLNFAPGAHSAEFIVTDSAGTPSSVAQTFQVAGIAPIITVNGLNPNDTLDSPREITVDLISQGGTSEVALLLNGVQASVDVEAPYTFTINPLDFGAPGDHIVTVRAVSIFGVGASVDIAVSAAQSVFPTPTPTIDVPATTAAEAAASATEAQAVVVAQQTEAAATAEFQQTEAAVTAEFQQTEAAATAEAEQTQAVATEQAQQAAQETLAASTAEAQQTAEAATAEFQQAEAATAEAEQTQAVVTEQAQQAAQETQAVSTAQAQQTLDAATAEFQQTEAATTQEAQQALEAAQTAAAREVADQTATSEAERLQAAIATADAQATADLQSTVGAEQTLLARFTAEARQTQDARDAIATVDSVTQVARNEAMAAERQQTAAALDALTLTAAAQPSATPTPEPSLTDVPTDEPTAEATVAPTDEPTDEPTVAPTDEPTAEASVAPTEEPSPEATTAPSEEILPTAVTFDPTSTPGSLVDVIASAAEAPDTPIALIAVVAGIGLLILIAVLIWLARRRQAKS